MEQLIEYVVPLILIAVGIYQIGSGHTIGTTKKQEAKYTRESLDKAYRISGYPLTLAGILLLVGSLSYNGVVGLAGISQWAWFYASLAAIVVYIIIILIYRKRAY